MSYSAVSSSTIDMPNDDTSRLAAETSPYLQQHADNPVHWYPWGEEALQLAKTDDKPILLSVGYSACHWCHVMAHESFEDPATAEVMNKLFVNIKVDREERPDIDKIYQTAHQLLTQRPGGWPLTMFIDPQDQRPFFGGTYFPDQPRHGMPSFVELITRVASYYQASRDDIRTQGQQLIDIFGQLDPGSPHGPATLSATALAGARRKIEQGFDPDNGGTKGAPKFPHPTTIERMLRHWRATAHSETPDVDALFQATLTLTRMAEGGIYDHVGGGFCRYSVDAQWQIPHFEKMLYDNGPLLALYAQAWLATGDEFYAKVARETANWIRTDMEAPGGGFWSSRDADSEGEEGLYYVWDPDQVRDILTSEEFAPFARRFGLDVAANFDGKWHLTGHASIAEIAAESQKSVAEITQLIDAGLTKLHAVRTHRSAPARDEKQLTSWNALAIRGLAIAGRALQQPDLIASASKAVDFLQSNLMCDGRLLASFKDGTARFPAYLDDHAFLLDGLLELLQAKWSSEHLSFAIEIADLLLEHFMDTENGGFYFTANDHEELMHRPKPFADEAMPAGNGIAALALQRLGFLLGETRYLDAAETTLRCAWKAMDEFPHGHVSLITALEEHLQHPESIVIRGENDDIEKWRDSAAKVYAPKRMVFAIPASEAGLPGALVERRADARQTVAYRCRGSQCSLPIASFEALAAEIRESDSLGDANT